MMIQSVMSEADLPTDPASRKQCSTSTRTISPEENVSLRLLLAQAGIMLGVAGQAGIDAKEREAADKLQKLILEELHHRIKNTLATVERHRVTKSERPARRRHGQQRSKADWSHSGGRTIAFAGKMGQRGPCQDVRGATEP